MHEKSWAKKPVLESNKHCHFRRSICLSRQEKNTNIIVCDCVWRIQTQQRFKSNANPLAYTYVEIGVEPSKQVQGTSRRWPASDSNLQRPRTAICFSSGFSGCQWLCCSPFAPTAHSSSKLPVITHAEPKTIEMQRLCHALNCLRHPPLIHRPGSQRGAR